MDMKTLWRHAIILYVYTLEAHGYSSMPVRKEIICDDEEAILQCPGQSNIIIKEAYYGHIGISRCVEFDTGHLGCKVSVIDTLVRKCAGKGECTVAEHDQSFRQLSPCRKGLYLFLEISYVCTSALPVEPCKQNSLTSHQSYISSQQSTHGRCQSHGHYGGPQFYFTAKQGQKVKISVLSLTATTVSGNATKQVGYVVDESQDKVYPLEVNLRRTDVVPLMISKSSEVMVSIHGAEEVQYLVFLQAVGCEDLRKPEGNFMVVERSGDHTTVRCTNSDRSWNLQCIGVHWAGVIGNCTQVDAPEMEAVMYRATVALPVPKEIVLMIIVGITVILALCIITAGYVCYKRTLLPLPASLNHEIAYNNLKQQPQPEGPMLPEKRGSTLLRNLPTLSRGQPVQQAGDMWEPQVPLPPPRRENKGLLPVGSGGMEAVPLRSGDLLLDNGNETILVRGGNVNVS